MTDQAHEPNTEIGAESVGDETPADSPPTEPVEVEVIEDGRAQHERRVGTLVQMFQDDPRTRDKAIAEIYVMLAEAHEVFNAMQAHMSSGKFSPIDLFKAMRKGK